MNWLKMDEHKEVHLFRGSLIRFSASYPFEDEVVMIMCDSANGGLRLGLIPISGKEAGYNGFTMFPEQALNDDGSITAGMIYENWATWISPEWSPDRAWILHDGLSAGDLQ